MPAAAPAKQRFWRYVVKTDGCWSWVGAKLPKGYGRIGAGVGKSKKVLLAHRLSYEIHYGPIPDNVLVCHSCDNPNCVNPSHLFLGTHKNNFDDAKKKGRIATGDRHGSKTHPESVLKMRASKLGKKRSKEHIDNAVRGKMLARKNRDQST